MDLVLLQKSLRQFAAEREWEPFHTPKNLAVALMVEAAELAEIFQWMTPEQSQNAHGDKVVQEHIGDEVADVLLYLLQLADHSAIDLKRAVGRKLVKNAKKHPPVKPGLPIGPMALLDAPTHVLVDWENVQPKDKDILALVPGATHVWIFHGKTQKKVDAHQAAFGDNLTLIPITRAGKNALDFHLSFYMGYITSRHPEARIVVISNDQGYGPMLAHAQDLGFVASQLGFAKPAAVARKTAPSQPVAKAAAKRVATKAPAAAPKAAPARKPVVAASQPAAAPSPKTAQAKPTAATKKAPAKKAAPTKAAPKAVSPKAAPVLLADADYAHVVKSLQKSKNKPTRKARLQGLVRSLVAGGKADDSTVEAVVARLVADRHVAIDAKGAVSVPA